jgi:hypothetical protein
MMRFMNHIPDEKVKEIAELSGVEINAESGMEVMRTIIMHGADMGFKEAIMRMRGNAPEPKPFELYVDGVEQDIGANDFTLDLPSGKVTILTTRIESE